MDLGDFTDDILRCILKWDPQPEWLLVCRRFRCVGFALECNFIARDVDKEDYSCYDPDIDCTSSEQQSDTDTICCNTVVTYTPRNICCLENQRVSARATWIQKTITTGDCVIAIYRCVFKTVLRSTSMVPRFKLEYVWYDNNGRCLEITIGDLMCVACVTDYTGNDTIVFNYYKCSPGHDEAISIEDYPYHAWFVTPVIEFCSGAIWTVNDAIAEILNADSKIFVNPNNTYTE